MACNMKFCQSCGMPLTGKEILGTNDDGNKFQWNVESLCSIILLHKLSIWFLKSYLGKNIFLIQVELFINI